jgi:hypothetical protein
LLQEVLVSFSFSTFNPHSTSARSISAFCRLALAKETKHLVHNKHVA